MLFCPWLSEARNSLSRIGVNSLPDLEPCGTPPAPNKTDTPRTARVAVGCDGNQIVAPPPCSSVPAVLRRKGGAVTSGLTRTINQSRLQNSLGKGACGCGGAFNSLLVALGDKCGLYATVQYGGDVDEPIVRTSTLSIAKKRTSGGAADANASPTPGEDRAVQVQREEAGLMTLICHDCGAATDSHTATP